MKSVLRVAGVAAALSLALAACGGGGDPLAGGGTGETGGGDPAAPSASARPRSRRTSCSPRCTARRWRRRASRGGAAAHRQPRGLLPGLRDGSIDLVPEYTGVLLQFLDETAEEKAPDEVYTALQGVVPEGLTLLERSEAENKDAVVVTRSSPPRTT
jgi:osmoprotectant transport system substrate-binding protein